MNKHDIGSFYEKKACDFLSSQGISVIGTNYRTRGGEIDIIAKDGEYLAFVEVKFRKNDDLGGAWYAIGNVKRKRIRETAAVFMREKGNCGCRYFRFDAVLITGEELEYIQNAWQ